MNFPLDRTERIDYFCRSQNSMEMRIIFNTSFIIEEKIEDEWINFIRKDYIAKLKDEQICDDIIFTKVSIDQPDGKTYSLQLVFSTQESMNHFLDNQLTSVEEKMVRQYANRYVCFSSILTEI